MLLLVIGALIYSVGTQSFIVPANIAPGGAVGIALMMNYVTGLPVGQDDASGEPAAAGSGLVLSKPPFRASGRRWPAIFVPLFWITWWRQSVRSMRETG